MGAGQCFSARAPVSDGGYMSGGPEVSSVLLLFFRNLCICRGFPGNTNGHRSNGPDPDRVRAGAGGTILPQRNLSLP